MKYKMITFFLAVCLSITAIFLTIEKTQKTYEREQQHLISMREVKNETSEFQTHLPIVCINTNGETIVNSKVTTDYTMSSISIIDNENQMNKLTDKPKVMTQSEIKVRGNSSRQFDKLSYGLRFVEEGGENNSVKVMGMPKNHEWILNGPFLDKTLMRNYMLMNISAQIMGYAPRVRYCEVFLNEKSQGLYLMMEPISQGEKRVNISKSKDSDTPYTSYIVRLDRGAKSEFKDINNFSKYTLKIMPDERYNYGLDIEYPTTKYLTQEKKDYIVKDFSQFEKSLYSFDYNTKDEGYSQYIDVQSFVDYYVINEFFQNYDAAMFSTYLYKDIREKMHIGPVWDFNNCMDNYIDQTNSIEQTQIEERLWYDMLFKDKEFVERVIARYKELRKTVLSQEYLFEYIDKTETYLGTAIKRNDDIWGYSYDASKLKYEARLNPIQRNPLSYDDSIQQMKDYIEKRGDWLDQHIEYLRNYSHDSKTKKYRR